MKEEKTKVYISGSITKDPDYKRHFNKAERFLRRQGYAVFNPAKVPNIFSYDEFMKIDLAALECCDCIYLLRGWENSRGAFVEFQRAKELKIKIMTER